MHSVFRCFAISQASAISVILFHTCILTCLKQLYNVWCPTNVSVVYWLPYEAKAIEIMNATLSELYSRGFWLRSDHGKRLGKCLKSFLFCYARCAHLCMCGYVNHTLRFTMIPKVHFMDHIATRMVVDSAKAEWIINPVAESVQMQEDYIGRPARLSRRVNPRLIHQRVLERSLLAMCRVLHPGHSEV